MSRAATKSNALATPAYPVPAEKIALRAYEKWCDRGYAHGSDMQDWLDAERELQTEMTRTGAKTNRR
jgi:hypothetical protein